MSQPITVPKLSEVINPNMTEKEKYEAIKKHNRLKQSTKKAKNTWIKQMELRILTMLKK